MASLPTSSEDDILNLSDEEIVKVCKDAEIVGFPEHGRKVVKLSPTIAVKIGGLREEYFNQAHAARILESSNAFYVPNVFVISKHKILMRPSRDIS